MVFGSTDPDALIRVYFGKGCPACHETGFRGRTGIFEVFTFNDILRKAIIDERNSNEIEELARSFGMKTMLEDGLVKVKNGMTTMEEVIRVSRE
jgi:type II secretory ATPase GspE/PulE/Tfp pilus assembly ATPase PilB-like protein